MKSDEIIEFLKSGSWEQPVLGSDKGAKIEYVCHEEKGRFIQELKENGETKFILSGSYRTEYGKISLLKQFLRYIYSAASTIKTV